MSSGKVIMSEFSKTGLFCCLSDGRSGVTGWRLEVGARDLYVLSAAELVSVRKSHEDNDLRVISGT